MKAKKLIFIQLNELNFDMVKQYVSLATNKYPSFEYLLREGVLTTSSESEYTNLEPWIQWPSVHTGLSYDEHQIFRLGDVLRNKSPQFFELLEAKGLRVGVVSAMNAENRLKDPAYFIPDPWTETPPDESFWSRHLSQAISQLVNDNSKSKISFSSAFFLSLGLLRFFRWESVPKYLSLLFGVKTGKWRKALFLDVFLNDLHLKLIELQKPNFSTLFLNAGAHIQHHYLLNSKYLSLNGVAKNPSWYVKNDQDPFEEMISTYDFLLSKYIDLDGYELIVATGLSQVPYEQVKFYYRLKNHKSFLDSMGLCFRSVSPRMNRDFLIEFDSVSDVIAAENALSILKDNVTGINLFKEIDNRGLSLFVTLTFPVEILSSHNITFANGVTNSLSDLLVFVAVKNGMHHSRGYVYGSSGVKPFLPSEGEHVKKLNQAVLNFFDYNELRNT